MFQRVVFSSKSYHWNTPEEAYKELDKEFHFTFDPAVPPIVGNFAGNALRDPWKGRVFVNPPYKRKVITRWVKRAWMQYKLGHCQLVVLLLPSRTGTDWFDFLLRKKAEFRINRGRLKFKDVNNSSDTKGKHGAPFDSLVAILQ